MNSCVSNSTHADTIEIADDVKLEDKLGKALVLSIVNDDIRAYFRCWTTSIHRKKALKKYYPQVAEEGIKRLLDKLAPRDEIIVHSFKEIQRYINSNNIDRKQIKFISCDVKYNPEEIFNGHKMISATQYTIHINVKGKEWVYRLDDCILLDNQWFFSDSPMDINLGNKTINFRQNENALRKEIQERDRATVPKESNALMQLKKAQQIKTHDEAIKALRAVERYWPNSKYVAAANTDITLRCYESFRYDACIHMILHQLERGKLSIKDQKEKVQLLLKACAKLDANPYGPKLEREEKMKSFLRKKYPELFTF